MKHKNLKTLEATTVIEKGMMTAIASTEDVDRSGDVLKIKDWDFTNFLKNPVLQAGHDYRPQYTIGVAKDLRVENNQVLFTPVFHEITPLASQIKKMYEQGILKAWSVGFIPSQFDPNDKNQLLEVSAVSVPDNQNALTMMKGIMGEAEGYTTELSHNVEEWVHKEVEPAEASKEDTEPHIVTEEDLKLNPELAAEGVKVGDEIGLPKIEDVPVKELTEEEKKELEQVEKVEVKPTKAVTIDMKDIDAIKQKYFGDFSDEAGDIAYEFMLMCDDIYNVIVMHKTALMLEVMKQEQGGTDTTTTEAPATTDISSLVTSHYGQMATDLAFIIDLHRQMMIEWSQQPEETSMPYMDFMVGYGISEDMTIAKKLEVMREKHPEITAKEGRVLSTANRKIVSNAVDITKQATAALETLLEASDKSSTDKSVEEKEATPQEQESSVDEKGRNPSEAKESQAPKKAKRITTDEIVLRAMQKIAKTSNFALQNLKSNQKESK